MPVTGWGPLACETSRLLHFLDSRRTDDGKVISPMLRPRFTAREILGTHLCYKLSRPQGHSAAGRIRSLTKSNDLIGNRIRDLLAWLSAVNWLFKIKLVCIKIILFVVWKEISTSITMQVKVSRVNNYFRFNSRQMAIWPSLQYLYTVSWWSLDKPRDFHKLRCL
jgi:hypothetical protein